MSSNQKGAIAELAIALHASRLGISVLRPQTEGLRYDLVFDAAGRLMRVQCKWATRRGDVVRVPMRGSYHSPVRGYVRSTYASDELDGIAAYCEELDRVYWLPIARFDEQTHVNLRLAPARNNQRGGVNMAADYELGAVAQLGERLAGSEEVGGSIPQLHRSADHGRRARVPRAVRVVPGAGRRRRVVSDHPPGQALCPPDAAGAA